MNAAMLKKVKQSILANPQRFLMSSFIVTRERSNRDYFMADVDGQEIPFDHCGTAACIAGWTCLMNQVKGVNERNFDFASHASDLLDLEEDEERVLFYLDNWPLPFYSAYHEATNQAERAQVAAQRIDYFIKTGR